MNHRNTAHIEPNHNPEVGIIHKQIEATVETVMTIKPMLDAMVGNLQLVHMMLAKAKAPAEILELKNAMVELQDNVRRLQAFVQQERDSTAHMVLGFNP